MSPADQPQAVAPRRSTDPPALWVSLALGSVLIHLVLFILASVVFTRHAKVQLDLEPVAVEFVDPNTATVQARSAAPNRAIAARPGAPSSNQPSATQAQPSTGRSQPFAFNQPVEQPFAPLPSARPRRVPLRPQPQQPNSYRTPVPQQPDPTSAPNQPQSTPFPQQFSTPNSSQTQPTPNTNPTSGGLTGSASNPTPQPLGTQSPVESGTQIAQPPQGRSVSVSIFGSRPSSFDRQEQPAQPLEREKSVSIYYPNAITQIPGRNIKITVNLLIDANGSVRVEKTSLLSPGLTINQADLDDIAKQIFETWKFEPAQNVVGGTLLKPPISNLTINAQIQFP